MADFEGSMGGGLTRVAYSAMVEVRREKETRDCWFLGLESAGRRALLQWHRREYKSRKRRIPLFVFKALRTRNVNPPARECRGIGVLNSVVPIAAPWL